MYTDPDCRVEDEGNYWLFYMVYAPAGYDAEFLCNEAWGSAENLTSIGGDVYGCVEWAD